MNSRPVRNTRIVHNYSKLHPEGRTDISVVGLEMTTPTSGQSDENVLHGEGQATGGLSCELGVTGDNYLDMVQKDVEAVSEKLKKDKEKKAKTGSKGRVQKENGSMQGECVLVKEKESEEEGKDEEAWLNETILHLEKEVKLA
jgi:hypothetical protein